MRPKSAWPKGTARRTKPAPRQWGQTSDSGSGVGGVGSRESEGISTLEPPASRLDSGTAPRISSSFFILDGLLLAHQQVFEPGDALAKAQVDGARGPVAVLGDDDLGDAGRVGVAGAPGGRDLPLLLRHVHVPPIDEGP